MGVAKIHNGENAKRNFSVCPGPESYYNKRYYSFTILRVLSKRNTREKTRGGCGCGVVDVGGSVRWESFGLYRASERVWRRRGYECAPFIPSAGTGMGTRRLSTGKSYCGGASLERVGGEKGGGIRPTPNRDGIFKFIFSKN